MITKNDSFACRKFVTFPNNSLYCFYTLLPPFCFRALRWIPRKNSILFRIFALRSPLRLCPFHSSHIFCLFARSTTVWAFARPIQQIPAQSQLSLRVYSQIKVTEVLSSKDGKENLRDDRLVHPFACISPQGAAQTPKENGLPAGRLHRHCARLSGPKLHWLHLDWINPRASF